MKFCSRILAIAILASTCAFISCAGPSSYSYQNVTLSLSYYPVCNGCATTTGNAGFYYGVNPPGAGGIQGAVICSPAGPYCTNGGTVLCTPTTELCSTSGAIEMPPGGGSGGCIEIFATIVNAPLNPTWSILPAPVTTANSSNVGTVADQVGTTNFYCEASAIPVYSGAQLAQAQSLGIPQGTTEVLVTNPADPNNPNNVVSAKMYFTYQLNTPPSGVSVGIFQAPAAIVPLGTSYQFTGWVAGVNGIVNGIPAYSTTWTLAACSTSGSPALVTNANGSTNYGTLNTYTGLYTAPTAYPSSTIKCANLTVASTAYPTIISSVTTINFP